MAAGVCCPTVHVWERHVDGMWPSLGLESSVSSKSGQVVAMAKMTPEQQAAHALDSGADRRDLPQEAQLAYDRLVAQRGRAGTQASVPQAWLEITVRYGERGPLDRDFPVAIDGTAAKGHEEQRTKKGYRKRWPVAPGTHTLRVGGGWLKSPEVSFTVAEGQTARFACESAAAGETDVRPRSSYEFRRHNNRIAYWLLRSVFQHDVWIRIGPLDRSPDL